MLNIQTAWIVIAVVETDFASSSEYVDIYVNGNNLGTCEPLDQDCSYDLIFCDDFLFRDITPYIDPDATKQFIDVTIDSSSAVNICPTENGNYLEAYVSIICPLNGTYFDLDLGFNFTLPTESPTPYPTLPTLIPSNQPTVFPVNDSDDGTIRFDVNDGLSEIANIRCIGTGCSNTQTYRMIGQCPVKLFIYLFIYYILYIIYHIFVLIK